MLDVLEEFTVLWDIVFCTGEALRSKAEEEQSPMLARRRNEGAASLTVGRA